MTLAFMGFGSGNPGDLVVRLAVLVLAITLHEWGHAAAATWLGDDTAKSQGRLTLDPLKHLDMVGSLAILFVGFGWGKPVPVSPNNFKNPKRDDMLVAFAGPAMNFAQALVCGLVLRVIIETHLEIPTLLNAFLWDAFFINVLLAVFNLIPVGPLDGAYVLKGLLPLEKAYQFTRFNQQFGWWLLLFVVISGVAGFIFGPVYVILRAILIGDVIS